MAEESGKTPPIGEALTAELFAQALRESDGLSADPLVAAAVVELTGTESADDSTDTLCRVVSADVAIAAQLLSTARRQHPRTADLPAAVDSLGLAGVRSVVLSMRLWDSEDLEQAAFRRGLALHSLAVAAAAKMLCAASAVMLEPPRAHVCGLLHDAGKLALADVAPKSHARARDEARLHADDLAVRERAVIGLDHTVAGRHLSEQWRLGEEISDAAWLHHQPVESLPPSPAKAEPALLTALADAVARVGGAGDSGSHDRITIPEAILDRLRLSGSEISAVTEQITVELETARSVFDGDESAAESAVRRARMELARESAARPDAAADRLAELTGRIDGESELLDIVSAVATGLAAGGDSQDTVVYAIEQSYESVVLARCGRDGRCRRRILRMPPGLNPVDPPAADVPAETVAELLFAEPEAITDFAPPAGRAHRPLLSGGTWVGGVFHSGRAVCSGLEAIAPVLGLVLGLGAARAGAQRRAEGLAAACRALEASRGELADSRTLAAVGQMAAGAAHEMNTPLAVISGRAQWMLSRCEDDAQRRIWRTISDQAQRVSDIVTALMEFAEPTAPRPEPLEVARLFAGAVERFSGSEHPQASSACVDIEVAEDTPAVWADRSQLSSALGELLANAATAAETTGVRLWACPDAAGRKVVLAVSDTGPGMDARSADAAATPFYSSRQAGRRRGLGLSMAKRFAEINGGSLRIETDPGKGTTVRIELPAAGSGDEDQRRTDDA